MNKIFSISGRIWIVLVFAVLINLYQLFTFGKFGEAQERESLFELEKIAIEMMSDLSELQIQLAIGLIAIIGFIVFEILFKTPKVFSAQKGNIYFIFCILVFSINSGYLLKVKLIEMAKEKLFSLSDFNVLLPRYSQTISLLIAVLFIGKLLLNIFEKNEK